MALHGLYLLDAFTGKSAVTLAKLLTTNVSENDGPFLDQRNTNDVKTVQN